MKIALALGASIVVAACSRPSTEVSTTGAAATTATAPAPSVPRMNEVHPADATRLGTYAPGTGLAPGTPVPDVHALDLASHEVALRALAKERGPLLLAFYRGGWCPYCSFEVHAYAKAYDDFKSAGILPVFVSVDQPSREAETQRTFEIPFPVLSDSKLALIDAFHVGNQLPEATLARYRGYGIDLESYSGESHHTIAVPSFFLIDKEGVVRWGHSETDYTTRPTPTQVLAAIAPLSRR